MWFHFCLSSVPWEDETLQLALVPGLLWSIWKGLFQGIKQQDHFGRCWETPGLCRGGTMVCFVCSSWNRRDFVGSDQSVFPVLAQNCQRHHLCCHLTEVTCCPLEGWGTSHRCSAKLGDVIYDDSVFSDSGTVRDTGDLCRKGEEVGCVRNTMKGGRWSVRVSWESA